MPDQLVPLSIAKSDTLVYWLLCNANATLSPFCYAHLCNRLLHFYSIHYAVDQLSGLLLTHLSLKQPMPGLKMVRGGQYDQKGYIHLKLCSTQTHSQ